MEGRYNPADAKPRRRQLLWTAYWRQRCVEFRRATDAPIWEQVNECIAAPYGVETMVRGGASELARHIPHALKRWNGLTRFTDDGCFEMDTNPVENPIRLVPLTRKRALFAGNEDDTRTWTRCHSLLGTRELDGVKSAEILDRSPRDVVAGRFVGLCHSASQGGEDDPVSFFGRRSHSEIEGIASLLGLAPACNLHLGAAVAVLVLGHETEVTGPILPARLGVVHQHVRRVPQAPKGVPVGLPDQSSGRAVKAVSFLVVIPSGHERQRPPRTSGNSSRNATRHEGCSARQIAATGPYPGAPVSQCDSVISVFERCAEA